MNHRCVRPADRSFAGVFPGAEVSGGFHCLMRPLSDLYDRGVYGAVLIPVSPPGERVTGLARRGINDAAFRKCDVLIMNHRCVRPADRSFAGVFPGAEVSGGFH
jgi:hypothetical protein